jgi:hypothetical protein
MFIGREEYEHCKGRFLRVTKTVTIAIIVEVNPKDKAIISLVETGCRGNKSCDQAAASLNADLRISYVHSKAGK